MKETSAELGVKLDKLNSTIDAHPDIRKLFIFQKYFSFLRAHTHSF